MKRALVFLFPFFLFVATQSSFAFPLDTTNQPFKKEKKQTYSQIWIEDYDIEIQVIEQQSKNPIEINNQEQVVEIINTINSAYDIDSNFETHTKLGVLKFNEFGAIQVYLSKDTSSVYLHSDKGAKVITIKNFHQIFQPLTKAEPLPPGFGPKSVPPLPKGGGLDSKDVEKLF
ncbi:hypothetical protein [Halobacillus seohaensis]|uniref:Uncharacterized protein n=1 Tax=Halobacillus seohaensis TaxID=447421 RepID=A0ABW2ET66_9BACI